ncbi:MAG: hypothetical protein M1820_001700 [Bogoriella megaspora]|nr:MAG: hypothetical protein M1820_001700 [Bogoriella megaspora]
MTLLGRRKKHEGLSKHRVQPPVFQDAPHPAASQTTLNLSSSPQYSSVLPPPYNAADFDWTGPPDTFYRQPTSVSASQPYLAQRVLIPHRPKARAHGQSSTQDNQSRKLLGVPSMSNLRQDPRWRSVTNLPAAAASHAAETCQGVQQSTAHYLNQGAALCDRISSRFNEVITSMDGQTFSGHDRELAIQLDAPRDPHSKSRSASEGNVVSTATQSKNYFSKVWQYGNARLPPHLPPLKVYLPTYPLLCLAAQYSERVYSHPTGAEQETHINADWRRGTKAMVIKSVPVDDMNTIVFAIRGSQTFMDWAVNFRPAPSSPAGFLDDPGNLCHSGFLAVAKHMIEPVSTRLRKLIEENPSRKTYSLLISGHSAGGAVAALLFAHMSSSTESRLAELAPFFRRIHCVTFGAPPVSLLPLQKPQEDHWKKSLFFSFVNEGDPVVRADKQVVTSLLKLYASPAPADIKDAAPAPGSTVALAAASTETVVFKQKRKPLNFKGVGIGGKGKMAPPRMPIWQLPPSTLSNAGRLVLLREEKKLKAGSKEEIVKVTASVTNDEQLRGVVFGDPICHSMTLYTKRIEMLATQAVTVNIT